MTFGEPTIDLDRMRAWKDEVVGKLTGGLGQLTQAAQDPVTCRARPPSSTRTTLTVVDVTDGGEQTLRFEHAIVATGSRPTVIPGFPDRLRARAWTPPGAWSSTDVPESLLVVGGGYIGLELGSVYAALGSKVTVVEMLPSLLPGVDSDLVRPLARTLAEASSRRSCSRPRWPRSRNRRTASR